MKFLDNLIAWGDSLYAQYTAETVSQAEQLYVLADMILGPAPAARARCPTPAGDRARPTRRCTNLDLFSNITGEHRERHRRPGAAAIASSRDPTQDTDPPVAGSRTLIAVLHTAQRPAAGLLGQGGHSGSTTSAIACNLQGVAQPLPLYAPPLNPLQLIAAAGRRAPAPSARRLDRADLPFRGLSAERRSSSPTTSAPTAR